jgi:hypothetical protein
VLWVDRLTSEPPISTGITEMTKTLVLATIASATLIASAASAHGRQAVAIGAGARVSPTVAVGAGAGVGGLARAGLGVNASSRGGLLNVQGAARTPAANVAAGVEVGGRGEVVSLDMGAFSGGVGH